MMVAMLLLAVVGVAFASGSFSGGGKDNLKDATNLAPNTNKIAGEGDDWNDREVDFAPEHEDLQNITQDPQEDFYIEKDENGDYEWDNGNETHIVKKDVVEDIVGALEDAEQLIYYSYNKEFDNDGFDVNFQLAVIYHTQWKKFKVVYSIDGENFVLPNLKEVDSTGITPELLLNSAVTSVAGGDDARYFIIDMADADDIQSVSSLFFLDDGTNFGLVTDFFAYKAGGSSCGGGTGTRSALTYMNNNNFGNAKWVGYTASTHNCGTYFDESFSISEYAYTNTDSLANTGYTRTTGFDEIIVVKQQQTQGIRYMEKKDLKFLGTLGLESIYDYNLGNNEIPTFMENRVKENVNFDVNGYIGVDGVAHEFVSEGDGLVAISIENGYFEEGSDPDLLLGTSSYVEVSKVEFIDENSLGFQINDLGHSKLKADNIKGVGFGNLKDDATGDVTINTFGTAQFVGYDTWDLIVGRLAGLFTFNYETWAQYFYETAEDPRISTAVEGLDGKEKNIAFETAFQDQNFREIQLTQTIPTTSILTYQDENYWLFWHLDAGNKAGGGCLIFNQFNTQLNRMMPSSVCDGELTGSNKALEFTIYSDEETN